MPAPIAKGILLSLSFLIAAGAAVYENPQVKQWVDDNRRKVAIALHNLGDELAPRPSRRSASDASMREEDSPEAAERRQRARKEILERARLMEERKEAARQARGGTISFDDLVNKDGSLKPEREEGATATSVESQPEEPGLRHRAVESPNTDHASTSALHQPYAVNVPVDITRRPVNEEPQEYSRSSTPTLAKCPPVPPKPAAYQHQRHVTKSQNESSHPSEQLIDLTPTTSSSSTEAQWADLNQDAGRTSSEMYMSVNEWAHNQSAQSFHSPPQALSRSSTPPLEGDHASVAGSIEHASQAGTDELDVTSEFSEGIDTPSTWTEVGSTVSEE